MTTIKAMRELAKASKEINNASGAAPGGFIFLQKFIKKCLHWHALCAII